MKATTKRPWILINGATNKNTMIGPGQYELERIRCPLGNDCNWLVLKGTLIGGAEGWWREKTSENDNFQIIIED